MPPFMMPGEARLVTRRVPSRGPAFPGSQVLKSRGSCKSNSLDLTATRIEDLAPLFIFRNYYFIIAVQREGYLHGLNPGSRICGSTLISSVPRVFQCVAEIESVIQLCDEVLCSGWAYWQMKNGFNPTMEPNTGAEGFFYANGTLQNKKLKALTHTYLQKVQGVLLFNKFYTSTSTFSARFKADVKILAQSELYWNKGYWYPEGAIFTLSSGNKVLREGYDYTQSPATPYTIQFQIINEALHGKIISVELVSKEVIAPQ